MSHEITRSAGLPTGYPGFIAGGGYSGATKELDDTVQKAAQLLAEEFGRDVEIRFNSDRRSGGAWLKDDLPRFSGSGQVGLSARVGAIPPKGKSRSQWLSELEEKHGWGRGMDAELAETPQGVFVATYISADVAKNQGIVNSGNPNHRYASHTHKSLAEGLAFLKRHVSRSKLNPYTGEVLENTELTGKVGKPSKRTKKQYPRVKKGTATLRGLRR